MAMVAKNDEKATWMPLVSEQAVFVMTITCKIYGNLAYKLRIL
jgi:hypothetical protein